MTQGAIIAVDLGGTQVRAARLTAKLAVEQVDKRLTESERGVQATIDTIADAIRAVWPSDGTPVEGIGLGAPGPLNPTTGVVVAPPNLKGWHNVPLGDMLKETFGVPVYVNNDANAAGLAETVLGAARGYRHVVYITVSTGIGSGIISDGKMLLGSVGLGAEAGHISLVVGDAHVSTLEKESAGPALARKVRERMERGEASLVRELVNGDLSEISGATVGEAVQLADPLALDVVQQSGRMLGIGMVTLLHLFNPEILVFGGGVSKIGEPLFKPMREAIHAYAIDSAYWSELKIEQAALGDMVGVIGAGCLVATRGGVEDVRDVLERLGAG